jgi:hypothetical protein
MNMSRDRSKWAIREVRYALVPRDFAYFVIDPNLRGSACLECGHPLRGRAWVYQRGVGDIWLCEQCHQDVGERFRNPGSEIWAQIR